MALTRPRIFLLVLVFLAIALIVAWRWGHRGLPSGEAPLRLTPVSFAEMQGWASSDPRAALSAFKRSCAVLVKKSPLSAMGGVGYAGTVGDWQGACSAAPSSASNAADARRFFETWFSPVAVSAGDDNEGLFTGYYEPELRASRTRHDRYQTPILGQPDDLIEVDLGLFRPEFKNEHIVGRIERQTLLPYPTRAEIDTHGLSRAPILVYAEDPVTVFFLHIQGSGRVRLDDGSIIRLAYAAKNGRAYTPIGRTLIARGELDRAIVSLQSIRDWLNTHPADAREVMETDASYVFFKEEPLADPALGSEGSEGAKLTPEASLAVDYRLHPLGAPFFLEADVPDGDAAKPDRSFRRLLIAQDTGGAIRGAVRGDVFWGLGRRAEEIAGRMKAHGKFTVLLPKPVAAKLGAHKDFGHSP
ncbi:MAG: murein transglycosylase A [Proteobacteria bacterium]|nr:murein transglycosylase A [Pseudomonadota bacterium]